jgi:hypothetical protein
LTKEILRPSRCAVLLRGMRAPLVYIQIEKTRNKLSETNGNNKKTNKQTNKQKKNSHKKKKEKTKTKTKQTTTQEYNVTAAARDLGTEPSGQLMFDGPQLCPVYVFLEMELSIYWNDIQNRTLQFLRI